MSERGAAMFRVGSGVCIARGPLLAVVDRAAALSVEAVWRAVVADPTIDGLLSVLAKDGIGSIGSFAIVEQERDVTRVLVRRDAVVQLRATGGVEDLVGTTVRTWIERIFPLTDEVSLALGNDLPSAHSLSWWIVDGVVPGDALHWSSVDVDRDKPLRRVVPVGRGRAESRAAPECAEDPKPAASVLGEDGAVDNAEGTPERASVEPELAGLDVEPGAGETPTQDSGDTDPETKVFDDAPNAADEDGSGYDYDALFGSTRARSVESAAVLPSDRRDDGADPALDDARAAAPSLVGRGDGAARGEDEPSTHADQRSAHAGAGAAFAIARPDLIRAVPEGGAGMEGGSGAPAGLSAETPGDRFGDTVARPLQSRAVPSAGLAGAPALGGPVVQALACCEGHLNPTDRGVCRECGRTLSDPPVEVPRPVLGQLTVSTGDVIRLDRPVLIGRNPRIEGRMPAEMPRIAGFDSFSGVSRTHLVIRLEAWDVLVEDLGSSNGTFVTLPGQEPRRLHSGEPVLMEPGTVIDVAGELNMTFEQC